MTFEEAATLMGLERYDPVYNVPAPSNEMEDTLAVYFNAEDEWFLRNIPPSCAIDVRTSLRCDFSAMQEKRLLYGLDVPGNAGGGFSNCASGSKHYW